MPATDSIRVEGLRDLNRVLAQAPKDVRREVRAAERAVGEPVRSAAQQKAVTNIRNIGPKWGLMRVGVTTKAIYVAPKARRRGGSPRPNLAGLLLDRAMVPALEENTAEIVERFDRVLDVLERRWAVG